MKENHFLPGRSLTIITVVVATEDQEAQQAPLHSVANHPHLLPAVVVAVLSPAVVLLPVPTPHIHTLPLYLVFLVRGGVQLDIASVEFPAACAVLPFLAVILGVQVAFHLLLLQLA